VPDPVIVDCWRVQAIFQGKSGLSEDQYVNQFAFEHTGIGADGNDVVNDVAERLLDFYNVTHAPGTAPVANYMAGTQIETTVRVKAYDLGTEAPRFPYETQFELSSLGAGAALPSEVAACLSYYATRNMPRRRGRIYLGPLANTAVEQSAGGVVVSQGLRNALAGAAQALTTEAPSAPVLWQLVSQRGGVSYRVTGGWVDDAPDTVRKRGIAPTARTAWGAPSAPL
jgi:hypothetical protein